MKVSLEFYRTIGTVTGVVILLQSILSILLWRERHHPLIRIRCAPLYFINLWLGVFLVGSITCLYYALYPHLPCVININWAIWTTHAFYTLPYVLRAFKFLYLYRTTQQRVKLRAQKGVLNRSQQEDEYNTKSRLLSRNRAWLVSDRFLIKLWAGLAFLHLLIAAILNIRYRDEFIRVEYVCNRIKVPGGLAAGLSVIYIVAVLFLVYFLKTAQDAFHLKKEARAVSLIWMIFAILWAVWEIAEINWFPSYIWPMIAMALCYFVTGFWIYWLIRRDSFVHNTKRSIVLQESATESSSADDDFEDNRSGSGRKGVKLIPLLIDVTRRRSTG
eukprot:TRINITY_DN10012_c0_g1_i2.p1 TRINITY_DN10012_c0_g1~~TRINITY_DN10012_c0_g1_i2.p1  ORF type:complete len:330 (-),score=20.33 TRINITY_DN10012_c0_g1_i2:58-1047(-)